MVPIRTVVTGVVLAAAIGAVSGCKRGNSLDGMYRIVSLEYSGDKIPAALLDTLSDVQRTVVIQNGKMKHYLSGDVVADTVTFDATKVPAECDIAFDDEKDDRKLTALGIYKLEGDKLTLSVDVGGEPFRIWQRVAEEQRTRRFSFRREKDPPPTRPTEFKSNPSTGSVVMVLQQVRDKKQ
jgi:uncharacterized protein (TIGR03067 family)